MMITNTRRGHFGPYSYPHLSHKEKIKKLLCDLFSTFLFSSRSSKERDVLQHCLRAVKGS